MVDDQMNRSWNLSGIWKLRRFVEVHMHRPAMLGQRRFGESLLAFSNSIITDRYACIECLQVHFKQVVAVALYCHITC
ncbi:hypothetical protein GQ37_005785 [Janthinobacterium sp. BJB1]|nr:hypothetical protein GQ37_005785 [Janthinobacterium sp. BJB1]